ncbi:MAG: aminoglycoside phosphotransferase family protein [Gemmataceae bacterium]
MSEGTVGNVLRALLGSHAPVSVNSIHGGFSGTRLWRIVSGRDLCLRKWPGGRSVADLRAIHNLTRLARKTGLPFVPAPIATTEHSGHAWDLVEWLPGTADYWQHPTSSRLEAASVALAQLHCAWQPRSPTFGRCPAVTRRLNAATAWQRLVGSGWRPVFAAGDPVTPWAVRAWRLAPAIIAKVPDELRLYCDVEVSVQPCLCDIWHDHVLFTGNSVSGLIDYGSVKHDHVGVDVARMLGDLVGDDEERWATGIAAYRRVSTFSDRDVALSRALDRTGVAIGLANWLTWLYCDERVYHDRHAVARRLSSLVHRAEALSV